MVLAREQAEVINLGGIMKSSSKKDVYILFSLLAKACDTLPARDHNTLKAANKTSLNFALIA